MKRERGNERIKKRVCQQKKKKVDYERERVREIKWVGFYFRAELTLYEGIVRRSGAKVSGSTEATKIRRKSCPAT